MDKKYLPFGTGPEFSVGYSRVPAGFDMKINHYHDFYEIYYFLGAEMSYFIENKTFNVKKFDMLFIDKFTYHRTLYMDKQPSERILVLLDDSVLESLNNDAVKEKILCLFKKKKISFPHEFNKYIVATFTDRILPGQYKSGSPASLMKLRYIFFELLMSILEMADRGMLIEDTSHISPQEKRVSEVVNYINSNYQRNISLDMLSKHSYTNKYYLCHIFKEITGSSIIDFINRKRLVEAESLLKHSGSNITEISEMVGFNSPSHFITLFKDKYECTPKIFRDRLS